MENKDWGIVPAFKRKKYTHIQSKIINKIYLYSKAEKVNSYK